MSGSKTSIVKDKRIMGGSSRSESTRIMDVGQKYEILDYSPEEIAQAFNISVNYHIIKIIKRK